MGLSLAKDIILTVITVVLNDAKRLYATIDSLTEFYGDDRFEHIVIDGQSTDKLTLDLVLTAKKHKNYKYISESDVGIYDAMNKGVHLAGGRFLLFLNCGDRMVASPSQLDAWLRGLSEAPGVDIGCFSCRLNFADYQILLQPLSGVLHKMPTSHQAMVFSRGFMQANLYAIQYRIAADFDLYLSAERRRVKIVCGSDPLTDIEAVGVASKSPEQSYKEYLQIAYKKLRGPNRWICLVRIGCRGVAAIFLKRIFPRTWVRSLQRLM